MTGKPHYSNGLADRIENKLKQILWILLLVFVLIIVIVKIILAYILWISLFLIGLIVLTVAVFLFLPRILARHEVLDRWDMLVTDGAGRGEEIIWDTQQFIMQARSPNVEMERREVCPGIIRGLIGETRSFLVISNTVSFRLRPFRMYISARDYGSDLQVSWFLVRHSYPWQSRDSSVKVESLGLDIFDEQDLKAYVTSAHHCLLEAVGKLMFDLSQDPSGIDRQSRGFLGVA